MTSMANTLSTEQSTSYGIYELYHRDVFKQQPKAIWLDGWKIEYLAIAHPDTMMQTPTIIVGGAFQSFNSYKYCVEHLFECGPVILVDLPSMGSNQQLYNRDHGESAATLELPDLSLLLGEWLDVLQLKKVSVMGMSLGSVVASYFADQRPHMVERLVLMGVMQKTRPSWRMLLEESLKLMQENRMEEFGQAVILYLVNHAKFDKTRMSPTAKKLFYRQMAEFTQTEQHRYEINCNRLLRLNHVPAPTVKTLVAAGQYDSFTLPFENAHFALQCPDMQFALIANADHVPQLQRRKETMTLFKTFLKGEDIHQVEGIIPMTRTQMMVMERRGEERIRVTPSRTFLHHRHGEVTARVNIVDLNFFGVLMDSLDLHLTDELERNPRDMALVLHDDLGEFRIECLIFEMQDHTIRALFKHGNFQIADRLLHYIEYQKQQALASAS